MEKGEKANLFCFSFSHLLHNSVHSALKFLMRVGS